MKMHFICTILFAAVLVDASEHKAHLSLTAKSRLRIGTSMSSALTPITDSSIETARDLWFTNETQCISEYGHISNWDTAEVTDMGHLF